MTNSKRKGKLDFEVECPLRATSQFCNPNFGGIRKLKFRRIDKVQNNFCAVTRKLRKNVQTFSDGGGGSGAKCQFVTQPPEIQG